MKLANKGWYPLSAYPQSVFTEDCPIAISTSEPDTSKGDNVYTISANICSIVTYDNMRLVSSSLMT